MCIIHYYTVYCKFQDIAAFPQLWKRLRWRSLDLARAIFLRAQGEHRTDDDRRTALFFLHGRVGLVVCPEVPSCCGAGAGLGWDGLDLKCLMLNDVEYMTCHILSLKGLTGWMLLTISQSEGQHLPWLSWQASSRQCGGNAQNWSWFKEKCRWADWNRLKHPNCPQVAERIRNVSIVFGKACGPDCPDQTLRHDSWLVAIPNQHTLRTVDSAADWWWFPAGLLLLGKRLRWTFTTNMVLEWFARLGKVY